MMGGSGLAQDKKQLRAFENTVMNITVTLILANCLNGDLSPSQLTV
jgi:hypothetical protein